MNRYDLYRYKNETAYINKRIEDIEILRTKLEKITPSYEEGGGTGISDKIGMGVAKLIDKQKDLDQRILDRLNEREQIKDAVEEMENDRFQKTILYNLYISEKPQTLIDLCFVLPRNYDYKYVSKLHRKALQEFDEKYDTPNPPCKK